MPTSSDFQTNNEHLCTKCGEDLGSLELMRLHHRIKHAAASCAAGKPGGHSKRFSRTISGSEVHSSKSHRNCKQEFELSEHERNGQPAIYAHLFVLLTRTACEKYDAIESSRGRRSLDVCLEIYTQLRSVVVKLRGLNTLPSLLAASHAIRLELLHVSTQLQCRNDNQTWDSVRRDDEHIVGLLKGLLYTKDGQQAVLSLRETEAESFLNLLDKVLIDGSYRSLASTPTQEAEAPHNILDGDRFRRKLHRMSVRLAQHSDQLPVSIYVEGVRITDKHNLNGGAFADIYRGKYNDGTVAVKRLRMTLYQSSDQRAKTAKALCREALIWLHLEHPHVLPFLGIDRTSFPGSLCMLSPWMLHGNIHDFIKDTGFVETEVHRLLYEVASGLAYLHKENIVHGDLRGPNILVDEFRQARLGDFGLANFADSTTASVSVQGTSPVGWTAPELLDPDQFSLKNSRPTSVSDVYAFGSVCWEAFTGKLPFQDLHMAHALTTILQGKRPSRPTGNRTMRLGLWCCVKACWMHQPSTRPSAQRISRFLKNYKSDPSTFPEFGQIKEGVSKSDLPWRSKRIKPDYITGVKHAPSPLSMLGNDDIEDETEPGFVPLEVREIRASENIGAGWSW